MARVQIVLESPQLVRLGLPIITVASYDIQRELNAAGQWIVEFPATEELAGVVRSRYRVSVMEEGRADWLLYRGIVTGRQFQIGRDGQSKLRLTGFTRLYGVAAQSTHIGLDFDGTKSVLQIANELTGETVTAPTISNVADRKPEVTFNDTSKLHALLGALEYERCNIRETFNEDAFELVSRDNPPPCGFRFVTVDRAGPDLLAAGANGMGLIAGSPNIGYTGQDMATRITPVATDFDGSPLTLQFATRTQPYDVRVGSNPDGSNYWYIEDDTATEDGELIEAQYVRSDIKNPNDNAADRAAAADVLYALAASRLLAIKSDMLAFASEIANGREIDALPGDRVKVEYRGHARGFGTSGGYWNIDAWFLIDKRRDASQEGGVRGVSFTLTTPEVSMVIPELPEEIPIPPPVREPPNPPDPTGYDMEDMADMADMGDMEEMPEMPEMPSLDALPDVPLSTPIDGVGPYQPCCAEPTRGVRKVVEQPPPLSPTATRFPDA